ncbi:hypothetical protein ACFLXI_09525, partial [Chloroflexota bacterium]
TALRTQLVKNYAHFFDEGLPKPLIQKTKNKKEPINQGQVTSNNTEEEKDPWGSLGFDSVPEEPTHSSGDQQDGRRRNLIILIGIVSAAICLWCCLLIGVISQRDVIQDFVVRFTNPDTLEAEPQAEQPAEQQQNPPSIEIVPTEASSELSVEERIGTATPMPGQESTENKVTSTPIPEPTEVLQTMEPGFIFEDDFEDGPDPAWEVIRGDMGMEQGRYTVKQSFTRYNTYHYAILSDYYWQDVSVEIEIQKFTAFRGSNIDGLGGIIVNYQENKDAVVLVYIPGSTLVFGYLSPDGQVATIDGSSDGAIGFHTGPHVIRVEVRGDIYSAFVDNELITYTQIPGKPVGQVGLWMRTNSMKDSLDYYAPRVEWIRVEALKPEE